jgi:hypothetical protein
MSASGVSAEPCSVSSRRRWETTRSSIVVGVPAGSPVSSQVRSGRRTSCPSPASAASAVETVGRRAPMSSASRRCESASGTEQLRADRVLEHHLAGDGAADEQQAEMIDAGGAQLAAGPLTAAQRQHPHAELGPPAASRCPPSRVPSSGSRSSNDDARCGCRHRCAASRARPSRSSGDNWAWRTEDLQAPSEPGTARTPDEGEPLRSSDRTPASHRVQRGSPPA